MPSSLKMSYLMLPAVALPTLVPFDWLWAPESMVNWNLVPSLSPKGTPPPSSKPSHGQQKNERIYRLAAEAHIPHL